VARAHESDLLETAADGRHVGGAAQRSRRVFGRLFESRRRPPHASSERPLDCSVSPRRPRLNAHSKGHSRLRCASSVGAAAVTTESWNSDTWITVIDSQTGQTKAVLNHATGSELSYRAWPNPRIFLIAQPPYFLAWSPSTGHLYRVAGALSPLLDATVALWVCLVSGPAGAAHGPRRPLLG
jgi:hypothetical protein